MVVALLGALALSACAPLAPTPIDPSGQRVFVPQPVAPTAAGPQQPMLPGSASVCITPNPVVAPVGTEVVLLATVQGADGYLRTNERVEWTIAPGGVGYFTGVGHNGVSDYLFGIFQRGKVDNGYAVGTTARYPFRLTRGTANPADDLYVRAGQAWVALTSPIEGASYVMAIVPEAPAWDRNKHTAVVYWLDANWQFPAPGIAGVGTRHVFTTTVVRHSDRSPVAGWHVRYDILDGPEAGFGPSGARSLEVETSSQGQASVEMAQPHPAGGTNRIGIQITRPGAVPGTGGKPFAVAAGSTMMTWTAPQIAVHKTGPAQAIVGANVPYQISVSNPGDMPADDVEVDDQVPEGMSYVSSNPAAQASGTKLQWKLGRIAGRETRPIQLVLRADSRGTFSSCADVTASGGLHAKECVTTTVGAPSVQLKLGGPPQVALNADLKLEMIITNTSGAPLTGLVIIDRFDDGLENPLGKKALTRDLARLEAGEAKQLYVPARAVKPGQQCHSVEVKQNGVILASAKGCLTVVDSGAPATGAPPATPSPVTPPTNPPIEVPRTASPAESPQPTLPPAQPPQTPPPTTTGTGGLTVEIIAQAEAKVGETFTGMIMVQNTGSQTLTSLNVVDRYDAVLTPLKLTEGYERGEQALSWKYAELPPGQKIEIGVEYRCEKATPKACFKVSVTSREAAFAQKQACLAIREAAGAATPAPATSGEVPGNLGPTPPPLLPAPANNPPATPNQVTIAVNDLQNPVAVGKEVTYQIAIKNNGPAAEQQVVVTVTIPDAMRPVSTGTEGPTRATIQGQTVRFETLPELAVNQPTAYYVRVSTLRAGNFTVHAEVTGSTLPKPLAGEAATQVFQ
jgi:uncharacterized repeat protein (TIGR01451 family)